jgi:CMP-N,N'-diacetyllegionaminic acid synthase
MTTTKAAQRTVLGIVPARAGSKGIPGKNIRMMAGKPLLVYTAEAALGAAHLSRVLLSTDDPGIADIGKASGLEVPFLRPSQISLDSTPMIDVVLHCIGWARNDGCEYDAVCVLQPTSPLRTSATIDRCISLLWETNVDSVISVRPVPTEYNPHWVYFETPEGLLEPSVSRNAEIPSRQQLPPAYHADGSVFVARTQTVVEQHSLKGKRTLGSISPEQEAVDLDTQEQWQLLERRLRFAKEQLDPPSAH